MLKLIRRMLITVITGALLCGALVRFAPGADSDERTLDTQLSQESIEAIRAERRQQTSLVLFYAKFLSGYLRGDLGTSRLLNQPVAGLIGERVKPTLIIALSGLAMAWLAAIAAATLSGFYPKVGAPLLGVLTSTLVSIPVALAALLFLIGGSGSMRAASLVVASAVFPRLARYLEQMLGAAARLPHVLTAHARGIPPHQVFLRHVAPCCRAEILALAGVSLSFGLSAAIPAEVVLDVAGVGQLAWQAALGRDLPLLVNVTMLITLLVAAANGLSDWAGDRR